jgi:hypothetical protein
MRPDGVWTAKGGLVSPEQVEAVRPVLERAMREGVTGVRDGGYTWIYQPLDPDPLRPPDDSEPTRRRGCSYSVLPYLVVALVVLWWRL